MESKVIRKPLFFFTPPQIALLFLALCAEGIVILVVMRGLGI